MESPLAVIWSDFSCHCWCGQLCLPVGTSSRSEGLQGAWYFHASLNAINTYSTHTTPSLLTAVILHSGSHHQHPSSLTAGEHLILTAFTKLLRFVGEWGSLHSTRDAAAGRKWGQADLGSKRWQREWLSEAVRKLRSCKTIPANCLDLCGL